MSAACYRANKRFTPSIQQRAEILNELGEGATISQLAASYGISTRSVQRIKRDAVQIRQLMEEERNSKRKRRCKSSCKNLDERLYTWFLERRELGDIITDLLLREKALEFTRELRGSSAFTASNGWLWRFKNRYGIRKLGEHGERDDTAGHRSVADKFIRDFNRRLEAEDIDRDYVYNMDETGLVWKTLPRKTLARAYENRIDGRKVKRDRVTVGFCANATGSHKLPPLFVYKCENPRALEHCKNALPVVFKSRRDARMDREIFADWYNNYFKVSVRERQRERDVISKVLLLVNNSRGYIHPEENISDDRFVVLSLPASAASALQPLNRGIVENTKRIYRYHMLKRILDFPDGVKEFYRYYNIRDCIDTLYRSWMDVTSEKIKNSWGSLFGETSDTEEDTATVTSVTLQRLINDIMGESIAPAELTEWLASCAEAEEEEEERQEQQGNTGNAGENVESRPPDPDDEEIKRPFGSAWTKTQNDFVQFHIKVRSLASMKVEGGVATTTVLQKVKVKEETKECCYQQATPSSTSATTTVATVATLTVSAATVITTTVTNSNGVSTVVANPSTITTVATAAPSTIICHPPTSVSNTGDSLPVDLDLKAKNKATSAPREKSSREEVVQPEPHSPSSHQRIGQQKQTNGSRSEYKGASGCSRSSDNDSPLPSQSVKPELEEGPGIGNAGPRTDEQSDGAALANGTGSASRCVSGIFTGHSKLKRLLGTLVQFATDISTDTGDTVRTLVLALLSGSMTAEEFHSALQEATNFPLRSFVLPYLKHTLPSLQRDLSNAARANNQSCVQFLRSNESAVLEAVGLVPSGESVEVFGEHGGANGIGGGNNQCSAHYAMRSNSNPGVGAIQHAAGSNAAGALHHYPGSAHAPKRRASDTPYYENGALLDDMPVYGKRPTNPWSHHHSQQQQQQQQQSTDPSYCWYHPLHSSGGSIQGHAHGHGHGPSPVPPSLVQINQINAFSAPHHLSQQQQQPMGHGLQTQNGGSLDDEWKNIHVMLNCILGMVEKTKRALAILQRRGCSSPAAAAPPPGVVTAQNGTGNNGNGNNGNNPSSTNGAQVESSTGDRDGNLKRLSGEIVAQTIRATEDRVAEVKRRAEEAVLEVKRAAVAEVQRAVAVAVAESRANERLRVHRLLDLPLSQRNHGNLRQGPFLRVHGSSSTVEANARNVTTPTTTPNSAPSTTEDEKDVHLTGMMGSSCWNCGRPALETCGGCGIARYCGSFCQHRDWEAGHHTTCNNLPPREPRRSASRSPPRVTATNLSASVNEVDAAPVASAGVSKGK